MRRERLVSVLVVVLMSSALATACGQTSRIPPPEVPGGDPRHGQELITTYGCGSCHTIAGVPGADGLVGPPLTGFGRRAYIAGELPNTGPNLERWIQNPQEVEPGTAMPDLGVTADDARDIAAYLFSDR